MAKKGIIVGNYNWYFYEEALAEGFEVLGVKIIKFKLPSFSPKQKILNLKQLIYYNKKLIRLVEDSSPEFIFFYRTNEIYSSTLKTLKKKYKGAKIIFFHNDNPFNGFRNKAKYFFYLNALKYTDITYVYRPSNISQAINTGAKNVKILLPHYCTKLHLSPNKNFTKKINDIIFIGHYENDRGQLINDLVLANINIKVYGPGWDKIRDAYGWPKSVVNDPVYGKKYKETIINSKMALCFFSKLNNDVYTRRNFEIPAANTLVVCQYTKEIINFFEPNKEIILFRNSLDLIKKIKKILDDSSLIKELTDNAFNRLIKDGHSELDRVSQILNDLK